ncbi:MAG: acyltransferase [Actinomycetes bacterium]
MSENGEQGALTGWKLWRSKWAWYHRDMLPWRRLALHRHLARAGAFARMPLHGEPLELLREGRLILGAGVLFEPLVWVTGGETGRIVIGDGVLININVLIAAVDRVEIGANTMIANGSWITDANHRFDDPTLPMTLQGFSSKGPTTIGRDCWLGANVVITSGVTVGERCVVGANSVVTSDLPPFSIAAGSPAKVIGTVPKD